MTKRAATPRATPSRSRSTVARATKRTRPSRSISLAELLAITGSSKLLLRGKYRVVASVQRRSAAHKYNAFAAGGLWLPWLLEVDRVSVRTGHPSFFAGMTEAGRLAVAREVAAYEYGRIVRGAYPDFTEPGDVFSDAFPIRRNSTAVKAKTSPRG